MQVLSFQCDLITGFAFITVDGKSQGDVWTVQCFLNLESVPEEEDYKARPYVMEIDCGDCGHNWGICGEANAKAFEYWGEDRCMTALFKHAEINGIVCKGQGGK